MLRADGHQLILWTVREGELLQQAVEWCRERGVEFWAVNRDYPEEKAENNQSFSRKIKADMFIDDRNLGGLPDWGTVYRMIKHRKTYDQMLFEAAQRTELSKHNRESKKKWWQF